MQADAYPSLSRRLLLYIGGENPLKVELSFHYYALLWHLFIEMSRWWGLLGNSSCLIQHISFHLFINELKTHSKKKKKVSILQPLNQTRSIIDSFLVEEKLQSAARFHLWNIYLGYFGSDTGSSSVLLVLIQRDAARKREMCREKQRSQKINPLVNGINYSQRQPNCTTHCSDLWNRVFLWLWKVFTLRFQTQSPSSDLELVPNNISELLHGGD